MKAYYLNIITNIHLLIINKGVILILIILNNAFKKALFQLKKQVNKITYLMLNLFKKLKLFELILKKLFITIIVRL